MTIRLEDWHRDLSKVAGSMSLRISKGKGLTLPELERWAASTRVVADSIESALRHVKANGAAHENEKA
jgi:hypothetical protein